MAHDHAPMRSRPTASRIVPGEPDSAGRATSAGRDRTLARMIARPSGVTNTMSDERAPVPETTQAAAERRWHRAEQAAVDELKSREDEMTDAEIIEAFREITILPPDEDEEVEEELVTDEEIINLVRG